jgi:hypothetical protein
MADRTFLPELLRCHGLRVSGEQEPKTREALQLFARHLARTP